MTEAGDELGRRLRAAAPRRDDCDWQDVLERAEAIAQPRSGARSHLPRRPLGWLLAAAALAAVAAVLIVRAGSGPGVETASAAAVLDRAALNVRRHALPGRIPPGRYWYQRYVTRSSSGRHGITETWISRTGAGRWHVSGAFDVTFPTASWRGGRSRSTITLPRRGTWNPYVAGGRRLTYRQMLRLPTAPAALLRLLAPGLPRSDPRYDGAAFLDAANLLAAPALPARLQAGVYRALAELHGVRRLGSAQLGARRGVVLGALQRHTLTEIVVDPRSGILLGVRTIAGARVGEPSGRQGVAHGRTLVQTMLAASGLVSSTRERR